jgi:Putative restriction endonuclease
MSTVSPPPLPWTSLPDHTQLPESDGTFVKNFQEHPQSILLTECLLPVLQAVQPDGRFAIGQDSGIYWRLAQPPEPPERGSEAPDWFLVLDVPPLLDGRFRRSYVLWQEHIPPLIILEFVSGDGSEERDRTPGTGKFWIYERAIRPAYYGIYEVNPGRIEMYQLVRNRFRPLPANAHGRYPIEEIGVELGLWQGRFVNAEVPWMRWWDAHGRLLPTGEERAEEEQKRAEKESRRAEEEHKRAEKESRRAEEEHKRADRLAAKLRVLGADPDAAS